jgi:zinc transport system substrate-binding protein
MTFIAVSLFFPSQGRAEESTLNEKTKIFVSIPPQAYWTERIAGPFADIQVLVGPGQSDETYEPTPRQMVDLSDAKLYFRIGLPFEDRLLKKIIAGNHSLKVIDTRSGVPLRAHDPHIWLAPPLAVLQARTITDELKQIDPAHEATYESNFRALQTDLEKVDKKIAGSLAPFKGKKFFVFHPAFGYFADTYGLQQVAVEVEGKEPLPKQLASLIQRAKKENVKTIFVQPQFSSKTAETLAKAIEGAVVTLDALAQDYLKNIETIAEKIESSFQ